MEQYIVSARKYRPSTFASVVGQPALTSTLKNAIASDRLAHAYLFCGGRGVGKTSCARIFAKTINCTNPHPDGEACNECDSCRAFNEGNSMNIIELDAASHNGIDDMKSLIEQVLVPPTNGRYRVFIIDEVHMLSTAAFNAFLKTLEEPPAYVIFILATTEKHKIIPTILSRCQIYDFNRISIVDMVGHLTRVAQNEGITAEPAALNVIARQADGAMRDALSIFDQVAASSRGNITYQSTIENLNVLDSSYYTRLIEAFINQDIPSALLVYHEVRRKGFDSQFFLNGLGQYMRDLMLASADSTLTLLDEPDDVKAQMAQQSNKLKPEFLYAAMGLCNDADLNYRQSSNKQLLVELTLIRIAQLLSPSPVKSGSGEGQIKPIAKSVASQATPAPTPVARVAPAVQQTAPAISPVSVSARPSTPVVAPPPVRQSTNTVRLGAISMRGNRSGETSEPVAQNRTEPVTVEKVAKAWKDFIAANPREYTLINVMRERAPITSDGINYTLTTGNAMQANIIREHLQLMMPQLHDLLQNDAFNFQIEIGNEDVAPKYLTDSELIAHIATEYPNFQPFSETLKLTLM